MVRAGWVDCRGVSTDPAPPRTATARPRWIPWAAGAAIVLVGALILLLSCGGDDDEGAPALKTGVPTEMSESELRAFGRTQAVPVYWAGPQENRRYEITRTASGRVYIRYLTPKADVGSAQPRFLTVGTYPGRDAYSALRTASRGSGSVRVRTQSGALVTWSKQRPTSVYFAFPDNAFQVEVYDPSAMRARSLVLDGRVSRLG
jgi:hypothetical protein